EALALRLQLNPHFMVNTLNAIAGLIATRRPAEAEQMTCRLADFLRSSLTADPTAHVPLEDEIATVEAYLEIERVRCGERLRIAITIPDELADAGVPNFILQPLVENAIKYGVAPHRLNVTVTIDCAVEEGRLRLRVEDRIEGAAPTAGSRAHPPSTGVGLANVGKRLALDYGGDASLFTERLENGFRAEIRLPLEKTGEGAGA
ncbi:MAG TPA: histidine kinase, partial [Allosphingosinicella sp.]